MHLNAKFALQTCLKYDFCKCKRNLNIVSAPKKYCYKMIINSTRLNKASQYLVNRGLAVKCQFE